MSRDKRVDDNWSLILSQEIAIKKNVPLIVCFQYLGKFQNSNIRQYAFLFKGLIQLKKRLDSLNIEFLFLQGSVEKTIPKLVKESDPDPSEIKINSEFGTLYEDGDTIPEGKKIGDVKEVKS